jgi:hypothetical protein
MSSILTRVVFVGIAGALAIGGVVPATAATRHRAAAPAAASEPYVPSVKEAPVAARVPGDNQTGPLWRGPNECFTDEGYGRFTSCDAGGAQ